ncbi:hypothetical protein BT69DRAFT_1276708 [Atractiella rhizophila]|nr:hypothetical protein BT69DRAFT_1276708 [Atractiella rhizophila]
MERSSSPLTPPPAELHPLERSVLEELTTLDFQLKELDKIIGEIQQVPLGVELMQNGWEEKLGLVFTLFRASWWSLMMQKEDQNM